MITIKKYAAIDIGSNAMRLLVTNIVEQEGQAPQFNKSSLVRVPIRLGQDAFTVGEITEENIEAISIVDNYLEHSRIYIFGNAGDPEVFISSADFMTRNLDARVEVTCPIYDPEIKQELIDTFEIGWKANVKARIHSADLLNRYRKRGDEKPFRAQQEMYNYYQNKLDVIAENVQ